MAGFTQNEPVGYTCSLIDEIKASAATHRDQLQSLIDTLDTVVKTDLISQLEDIVHFLDMLSGRNSDLEPIREANDKLRAWGNHWVEEYRQLEL